MIFYNIFFVISFFDNILKGKHSNQLFFVSFNMS